MKPFSSMFKMNRPFSFAKNFIVYIEKLAIEQTQLALTLYFDNEKNRALKDKFQERVVIMDCVFDLKNGLVAKSFRTRGKGTLLLQIVVKGYSFILCRRELAVIHIRINLLKR